MPPKKTATKDRDRRPRKPRPCPICSQGIEYGDYKNLSLIKPFLNERA